MCTPHLLPRSILCVPPQDSASWKAITTLYATGTKYAVEATQTRIGLWLTAYGGEDMEAYMARRIVSQLGSILPGVTPV